jgi:Glycosyltransferase family 87
VVVASLSRRSLSRSEWQLPAVAPLAAVTFMVVFGLAAFVRWNLPSPSWGIDAHRMLNAGARLAAGTSPWVDRTYFYPPVMALIGASLVSLPASAVVAVWATLNAVLVALGAWILAPVRTRLARAGVVLAALTFLPVLENIWQGNVSVVLTAAMAVVIWGPPSWLSGAAMGLVFAVAPKPILLPFAFWMLVWRPRAFVGAIGIAAVVAATSLVFVGVGTYVDWARAAISLAAPPVSEGNIVLAAEVPQLALPAALAALTGLMWVLWKRDEVTGLIWAVTSGVFLTRFGGEYSLVPLLLVAAVMFRRAPRRTMALGPLVQVFLPVAFSLICALILAVSLTLGPDVRPRPIVEFARRLPTIRVKGARSAG